MKAAVLYGNEDLRYEDYPAPVTKPGTVKVRVRATGICGSDVPRVLRGGAHFYPIVLGHEFAGDIVETGDGVENLSVGDTVSGAPLLPCLSCGDCLRGNYALCKRYSFIGSREQGSFAEYVVLPAVNAVRYDSSIPYAQAAMFEPSTVALHGLDCIGYRGGRTAAILGAGTIGLFAMQWAKILGAKQAVVFDLDDGRLELARRLGADATVNTREDGIMEAAGAVTGGAGFDYVFEAAGSPVTIGMAFELAGNRAGVCFIGTPRADVAFTPKLWENINRKELLVTGGWMSYSAPFPGREWELTAHYLGTGQLKFDPSMIFRTYHLSDAAEAFALYRSPARVHGKIMLVT